MTTIIRGELRIYHELGDIVFVNTDNSRIVLTLQVPKPIPAYDKPDKLYTYKVAAPLTTKK